MSNLAEKISSLLSSPSTLEKIVTQAFGFFDKDKSGFIEGPEVMHAADKVLHLAGIDRPHHTHLEAVFAKVAGPDQRLDKAEFNRLVSMLMQNLHKLPNPAALLAPHAVSH